MKRKYLILILVLSLLSFAACKTTLEEEKENSPIIIEEDDGSETETSDDTDIVTEDDGSETETSGDTDIIGEDVSSETEIPDDSDIIAEESPAPEDDQTIFMIKRKYDENGNLLWEEEYDNHGRVVKRTMNEEDYGLSENFFTEYPCVIEWEYDESGNVIHKFATNAHNIVTDETTDEYDSNGLLKRHVKTMKFEYGKIESEEETLYNEFGNEIQRDYVIYDANGDKEQWTETEYDEESRIYTAKRFYYYGAQARVSKTVTEYDELGRMISRIEYKYDGSVFYEIYQEYYDNGIMKKQTMVQNGSSYECEFDEKGNTSHYSIYQDGILQSYDEYVNEYDGDILSQTWTHFDADGQWQQSEKTVTDLSKPYEINKLEWEEYDSDGNVTDYHKMIYDGQDNYLGYEKYDRDGTVTQNFWNSYEYEYDEQGRLISETTDDYRIEYGYPDKK